MKRVIRKDRNCWINLSLLWKGVKIGTFGGLIMGLFLGIATGRGIMFMNDWSGYLKQLFFIAGFFTIAYSTIGTLIGGIIGGIGFAFFSFLVKEAREIPDRYSISRRSWIGLGTVSSLIILIGFPFLAYFIYGFPSPDNDSSKSFSPDLKITTSTRDTKRKIILIGLDGATWRVINPLIEQDKLPHFSRLVRLGSWGSLKTLTPTLSPIIWASIATGKKPQKHGIQGWNSTLMPGMAPLPFEVVLPSFSKGGIYFLKVFKTVPLTSNMRKAKALWNILSEQGKKVGIVGWVNTWPAEEVEGFMVSDRIIYDLPDVVYPQNLFADIKLIYKKCVAIQPEELERFMHLDKSTREEFYNIPLKGIVMGYPLGMFKLAYIRDKLNFMVGYSFWDRFKPNLFALYLRSLDDIGHIFWEYMEPQYFANVKEEEVVKFGKVIENFYIFIDEIIGRLIERIDQHTTVIIVSDHGMEPIIEAPQRRGSFLDYFTDKKKWRAKIKHFSAGHDNAPEGIIILYGKDIQQGKEIVGADVLDITPTILYLLGLPLGRDMDGKVLTEAIRPGFKERNRIRYIASYEGSVHRQARPIDSSVDKEIKERLRAFRLFAIKKETSSL